MLSSIIDSLLKSVQLIISAETQVINSLLQIPLTMLWYHCDIVLSVFGPVRTRNRKSDILFMLFLNTVAKECIKAFKNKEFMAEPYLKAISDAYNKYRIYNISSRNAMLYLIDELLEF